MQLGAVFAEHGIDHIEDKIYSEAVAKPIRQHFMRTDIKDRRQITDAAAVKEIGNVGEQCPVRA